MDSQGNFKRLNLHKDLPPRGRVGEKSRVLKKFKPVLFVASILIAAVLIWSFFSASSAVFKFAYSSLVPGSKIQSTDGRVNILLLGMAGGKYDGAYLTDSIIVASYEMKSHNLTLISIPRDLWLDSTKSKVNATYEYGLFEKNGGDGIKYAKDKIDDILGFPIHYGVRLDFSGFAKAVDLVEGVEVLVPKTFDDHNYPIEGKENDLCGLAEKEKEFTDDEAKLYKLIPGVPSSTPSPSPDPSSSPSPKKKYKVLVNTEDKVATSAADFACRFERIHFEKGKVSMNGETALKFVRSRMGTNGEGSDYARSRRQQLVIQAFRSKALSLNTLINPGKIAGLLSTFGKSVESDIPAETYLEFYDISKNLGVVNSIVLGDLGSGKSVLVVGPASEYGGFVLIPPKNDFSLVKDFLRMKLQEDATASAALK